MQQIGAVAQQLKPQRRNWAADLLAGLTFAVVNVPQAMAHALLATVNPIYGIYTLMVAVPIGAIFTSSVYMNVSTTGALSVAAGAGLEGLPAARHAEALVALVLLVGIIQVAAGLLRLGFLVRFVSNAVMTGFLNGVAVLIILGQLGDLTGYRSPFGNSVMRALDLFLRFDRADMPTTVIGLLTLGGIGLLLWTPLRRYAFLLAIAVSTVLLALLNLPIFAGLPIDFAAVKTVGDVAAIPRALPNLVLPQPGLLLDMLLPAFSVALIGLIQGAGVSQGMPNPDGRYPNVSRDFFGQGAANLATAFVGGLPAGGSISGTVLIMGAGAQSRWANLCVGVFVAAIVLLAAPLVELVPMPALAALLIVAGIQGLRIPQARTIWSTGRSAAAVMVVTFAATLFFPLQYAVLLGMTISILLYVFGQSNKVVIRQWVLPPQGFPIEGPAPTQLPSRQVTVLQIYGSLFFAAAKNVEEMLPEVGDSRRAAVILGLRGKTEVGSTFINVLRRYAEELQAHDGKLLLAGVDEGVRSQLAKTGALAVIGMENVFLATPQIGEALNQAIGEAQGWVRG